jgi:hypothetical protein
MLREYFYYTTTASFKIVSNSSFNKHPTFHDITVKNWWRMKAEGISDTFATT